MKYIILVVLILPFCITLKAQKPAFPCCSIAGIDAKKNIVTVVDSATGKVQQFKPAAKDMGSLRTGDKIALQNGKITSVNGVSKTFNPFEPVNGFEPVNEIYSSASTDAKHKDWIDVMSLRVNDIESCCDIVTVKNKTTGQIDSFKTMGGIGRTLTLGQVVYLQNGYAMVQAGATASAAQKGWYAFKAGAANTTGKVKESAVETSDEKWVITPNPNLKGAMGRITIRTPEKSTYSLTVFKAGTDQQSAYRYIGTEFLLLPGQYDTRWWDNSKWRLSGIPVRRGMDTRIRAGMLNINLKYTEWVIYDETKTIIIEQGYDVWRLGLPVGNYYVKVNKDFVQVVIKDGEITEF